MDQHGAEGYEETTEVSLPYLLYGRGEPAGHLGGDPTNYLLLTTHHAYQASLRDTEALIEYCYACEPGATEGPEQSISRLVNPVTNPKLSPQP